MLNANSQKVHLAEMHLPLLKCQPLLNIRKMCLLVPLLTKKTSNGSVASAGTSSPIAQCVRRGYVTLPPHSQMFLSLYLCMRTEIKHFYYLVGLRVPSPQLRPSSRTCFVTGIIFLVWWARPRACSETPGQRGLVATRRAKLMLLRIAQ